MRYIFLRGYSLLAFEGDKRSLSIFARREFSGLLHMANLDVIIDRLSQTLVPTCCTHAAWLLQYQYQRANGDVYHTCE